ncbi:MAG: hypothetical protein AB199_02025 [Parcubacteria bacterium C7867-004]|nr:MAG: hypothetical protein AB199_02025 [Parcubacteria bacterium C7867-004]
MVRKPSKQRMKEYVIAGLLGLLVLWLLFLIVGILRKEEIARKAMESRKAELAVLEERKAMLEGNLVELESVRGQEATLRQTYGVARPGEDVIIVVAPEEAAIQPKLPWYKRVMSFFGFW